MKYTKKFHRRSCRMSGGKKTTALLLILAALLASSAFPISAQSATAHLPETVHLPDTAELPNTAELSEAYTVSEAPYTHDNFENAPIADAIGVRNARLRSTTPLMTPSTFGRARIYYPYPWGAMAVTLYRDGKRVLLGEVAEIGGTVYVPVQRYADLFGSFKSTYEAATERVTINGTNLRITVQVGDPYITVNERVLYTGSKVLSLGGWIFVPLEAMSKALGASVYIKRGYYEAYVTSGNPATVKWASEYYDSTDLYWLSRIISAEAKGEPLDGQIAVGNVVLNRKRSASFPNTVKDVVFDKKYGTQFAPTANGSIYNVPTSSATLAAKACLEGYTVSSRILYFYNPSLTSAAWISSSRPYIMTIGNHKFYG